MTYKYEMNEVMNVAKQASYEIEKYLRSLECTIDVTNVEDDTAYREKDIDLIWKLLDNSGNKIEITIEIKGDRWEKTGNYFFETISNKDKNTPGCFIYTEAIYIYYYFVNTKELHRIPVEKTRKWFLENIDKFKEKETSTPVGNDQYYITVGRLVPRKVVKEAIPEIKVKSLLGII